MTIDFKGAHYPKVVIVHAVFFYVRYAVSYRDLEEILAERGVAVDHATLNRWVVKYAPLVAANAQAMKRPTGVSWRMDETYIKVKGKWTYYYRAIDKLGKTLDFMLSEQRDEVDLSRFDTAPLIAFTATKEIDYGTKTDVRIPPRCGAHRTDQWADTQAGSW
jgi:putative transposase